MKNTCRSRYPARNRHYVLVLFWWRNSRIVCKISAISIIQISMEKDWYLHFCGQADSYSETYLGIRQQTVGIDCLNRLFQSHYRFLLVLLFVLVLEVKLRPARYWTCSMLLGWVYFKDKAPFCKKNVAKEVGRRLFEVGIISRDYGSVESFPLGNSCGCFAHFTLIKFSHSA